MIPAITEINFPAYATLHQATVSLSEMGDRVISTQVRIDGDVVPDFSGWELSFKGERFVLNTKEPQAMKDNSTRHSLVDLTFESWIARELKRYFFFEAASVNASTAIADKYKASVNLSIEDFVVLYNKVLDYYFGGSVVMSLYMSGQGQYSTDRALMEIDYTYLWDVLVKFYEVYDVRWTIEFDSSTGVYTIKVGYPPASIDDHVFEYGFSGGLLKFERQVQDVDIHNILLGRGGEKNIPYRYFKRTDPQNPDWTADPDAIPELSNIYFDRLRDINFRWYVRGWMQNPNRDTSWEDGGYVYPVYSDIPEEYAWAYERGRTDEKFNPVEYVKDDESIAEYGERWGALDDNDEIYPTILGVTRAPIGRIDETVAVSEIVTDDIEAMSRSASVETSINEIRVALQADTETQFQRLSEEFTIPAGSVGDISYVPFGDDTANPGLVRFDTENSTVVATADGVDYPISGIPAGTYRLKLNMVIRRDSPATSATGTFGIQNIVLTTSAMDADAWKPTFDIWVKNIWGTTKLESESEEQYAERVWLPILGDRAGNEAKIVFSTGFMSVSQDYEFTIASYPVHDTSKSINGVPSEWRITLRKSDAEFDVTGLYLPNATTGGQPIAGDKFFFIGIDMPFYYVQLAEEDLNTYKSSELDTVASINPTWIITLDKVRANTRIGNEIGAVLADRITAGTKLKITDPRFTPGKILTLYAQSVTYTWQEPTNESPYIVPDIEVVLSDKVVSVESTITRIQNDVSYVKNQYARISDVEAVVRSVAEPIFLKKTGESDSSASPTQFSSKVTSKGFRQGSVGGSGWGIYRDNTDAFRQQATRAATRALSVPEEEPEGDAVIEADRIVVRKELQVNSLVINQIAYVGGKEIISAAKIEVTKVIETNDGYICYFDQKRNSVANNFALNDIAFGQVFNPDNTELRYYKMVVTATDIDSITLAKSGRDGSGAPEVGDIIVQYGNTTNTNRQYVIVRDVVGGGYERMISNLNSVSATGKEYYFAGRQGTSGPRWFVGDSLGDYAEYVNGVLTIKANVIFKAGQTIPGLADLEDEVDGLSDDVDGMSQELDGFNQALGGLTTDVDALKYLKTALPKSDTIITGGLILSKVIALRDANNAIKSGINGDPSLSSIAAWYGGPMADKEASPTPSSYAQSLFRFDGSGYLAGGKISWGANGAGSIPGVSWSADGSSIIIGGNVKLASASGDTVTELLTALQNLPNTYVDFTSAQTISGFKTFTSGIQIGGATLTWVEGTGGAPGFLRINSALSTTGDQIVGNATPGGGGGGGGASSLYQLDDVSVASRASGDLLQYNGSVWVNTSPSQLPVATASANGLLSSSDFTKLSGIATGATRVTESTVSGWGFTKNAGTVTSVKVGSTSYNPSNGVVSLPAYPTTLPASDVYAWAKAATKPSYTLDEVTDGSTRKLANYVLKAGDTMTGTLTMPTGSNAMSAKGVDFGAVAHIGASSLLGVYCTGNIVLRPGDGTMSSSYGATFSTSGLSVIGSVTSAGLLRSSSTSDIGTSSAYWRTAYVSTIYLASGVFLSYDSASGCVKITGAGLLTTGDQITGSGSSGGGGGGGGASSLFELADVLTDANKTKVKQYDGTTNAANGNMFAFNGSKWYALKLGTNLSITNGTLNATDTTYSSGTGLALSNGVFSIASAYQGYITHGESAYNSLGNYLPLAGGTMTGNLKWNNSTALPSTTSTSYILCIDAFADGGTTKYISTTNLLSGCVKKAGDSMSGSLAICLTPNSSYPVDRTKANLIIEDDNAAATGEVRGGNIIISRGYSATANQSAGAISFYGRRLSGGYRNGARIAAESTPEYTAYDRQDLVFYRSNNSSDSVPTWEESMRISSQGQTFIKGPFTYSLLVDNTASGAASAGIRFRTEGTTIGGIFVNSSNDLYFSSGTSSTGSKVLTSSNYDSYALPLSAGSSYPLTGHLYLNEGLGIQAVGGVGLFVYHPTSGWSGIDSTQWGLGSVNSQGVIRSSNSDLLHYKGSNSYSIWDASNSGISTKPWACSTLSVNTSLTLPNDVSILGTLTDSSTVSIAKVSTSNNIVIGGSSFAHNVNLYGTLVKFYAGGTTAIGTVSSTGLDVTGTVTASGIGTFDRVVLSNSGAVSHIEFTRAGWNYVSVPTDGVIAFNTGGSGSANTTMAVTPDGIRPGTKAVHSCGLPTAYWGSIYGKDLYLGGDTAGTAAGSIIFTEKLDSQQNGFKIAPYHAGNRNRISLDFFSSNNSTTSPYAPVWKRVLRLTYAGNVYMGEDATNGSNLTVYGSITSSGDQVISSDASLKKNWRDLKYGVADIAKATAGVFDWKDGKGESAGTKAQDWMHLVPQLVHGEEGHMTLAYGQIAMLNTILLARRSEDHETRIKALELENAELRKEIERLRS